MSTPAIPTPHQMREAVSAAVRAGDYRKTEWEVAFHEAGHVVVEVATGSYPDEVYLNDGEESGTDHAGRMTSRSFIGVEALALDPQAAAWLATERLRYASVLAAGNMAADLARGHELDHYDTVVLLIDDEDPDETDAAKLRTLVDGMTAGDAEAWLEAAFNESERLLRERWADVGRIAAALVGRRHLSRDDLFDLFGVPG